MFAQGKRSTDNVTHFRAMTMQMARTTCVTILFNTPPNGDGLQPTSGDLDHVSSLRAAVPAQAKKQAREAEAARKEEECVRWVFGHMLHRTMKIEKNMVDQ